MTLNFLKYQKFVQLLALKLFSINPIKFNIENLKFTWIYEQVHQFTQGISNFISIIFSVLWKWVYISVKELFVPIPNNFSFLSDEFFNKKINENWSKIFQVLQPDIQEKMSEAIKKLISDFFKEVPINEIFPNNSSPSTLRT